MALRHIKQYPWTSHETGERAEDLFQKITRLERMPSRWPVYDFRSKKFTIFRGRKHMGFDGFQTIQVKGAVYSEREIEYWPDWQQWIQGQFHFCNLNSVADITVLGRGLPLEED
jgi:hypothetical protein